MFEKTGIVTEEMLQSAIPPNERRVKGPYAVFECFQEIPCNPCSTACKFGAVEFLHDINDTPKVNFDKCSGCSLCVSACPGLACFIIDETYSEQEATIKIPFEFLPLPEKGQVVKALDRQGNVIGNATVTAVQNSEKLDRTNVITIAVQKELLWSVRNIETGVGLHE